MQGQQINLKWKTFQSNILSSFETLWEEEGLVDVTLATDGRCFKAHKIILSASSPFFKKIFQMNPCQHPVIVLQDVHFSELESILKFVYTGEVNIKQENLPLLLRAAETLQIRGLCRQLNCDQRQEEKENLKNPKQDKLVNERSRSPPPTPLNFKKMKNHHNFNPPPSPPSVTLSNTGEPSSPSFPVLLDEIKHEGIPSKPEDSSALTKDNCKNLLKSSNVPETGIDSEDEDHDLVPNTNEGAFDLDPASATFPFPPFPCPFCDRAYTRWGFRRRHIKACHTLSQSLPCKWCLEVLPTHTDWESHVCLKHSLSRNDAKNGLLILEEAEVVLQIPQPTRLETLVTMIKEQKNEKSEENSKIDAAQKLDEDKKEKEVEENECSQEW